MGVKRAMWKRYLTTTLLAYGLLGVFFALERRLRQGQAAQSLEAGAFDRESTRLVGRAFVISTLGLLLAPGLNLLRRGRTSISPPAGWVGLGLMVSGIGLRAWANRVLGAFYTRTLRVAANQPLIEQGPYRLLRHPGYSGSLLLWIGAGLATANWLVTSVIAIVTGSAYVYRVRSEETMLEQTFGPAYQDYRQRTWKLIPFVY
jgi:protein-S-isoprenylcysteine O-methyltransferase Ste14